MLSSIKVDITSNSLETHCVMKFLTKWKHYLKKEKQPHLFSSTLKIQIDFFGLIGHRTREIKLVWCLETIYRFSTDKRRF